ncbi:MAG: segregation/condensation protein A [Verrucomicrobiota bacterium]|nr:segregation/condensation protein A [Verrucomicrobiota bacterium]
MTELRFQFEVFEGPLDLLLHLVRKEEVDIYEVDMVRIADQFCEYVDLMKRFDLHVAGEFIVMASTLMYIKSKELLPVDQQVVVEEEDDEDPRWDLIRQLVEYRKFKDAGDDFKRMEWEQEQSFLRQGAKPKVPPLPPQKGAPASIFDLVGAINDILTRFEETEKRRAENTREIFADKWTVSQKIVKIRELIEDNESILFSELFEDAESRQELVATFLALLELVKLKILLCIQGERFGEIELTKRTEQDDFSASSEDSDDPESVGFNAVQAGSLETESIISKTAGLGVSVGKDEEVLTMNIGELAHKDSEPISFELPEEDSDEEAFDDPNFRELPLASDIPIVVKNNPPSWTSELNLNYPTKDRVIAMTLLTVVIVLLALIVL